MKNTKGKRHEKLFLLLLLAALLTQAVCLRAARAQMVGKDVPTVEKIKKSVDKLRAGARVTLKLMDGTKLRGNIAQTGEDDFVFINQENGQKVSIPYRQVIGVKGRNNFTKRREP